MQPLTTSDLIREAEKALRGDYFATSRRGRQPALAQRVHSTLQAALCTFGFHAEQHDGFLIVQKQQEGAMANIGGNHFNEVEVLAAHLDRAGIGWCIGQLLESGISEDTLLEGLRANGKAPQDERELWNRLVTFRESERHQRTENNDLQVIEREDEESPLPSARVPSWFIDPEIAGVVCWLNSVGILTRSACVRPIGPDKRLVVHLDARCARWAGIVVKICRLQNIMKVRGQRINLQVPQCVPLATLTTGMMSVFKKREQKVIGYLEGVRQDVSAGMGLDYSLDGLERTLERQESRVSRHHIRVAKQQDKRIRPDIKSYLRDHFASDIHTLLSNEDPLTRKCPHCPVRPEHRVTIPLNKAVENRQMLLWALYFQVQRDQIVFKHFSQHKNAWLARDEPQAYPVLTDGFGCVRTARAHKVLEYFRMDGERWIDWERCSKAVAPDILRELKNRLGISPSDFIEACRGDADFQRGGRHARIFLSALEKPKRKKKQTELFQT